MQSQFKNLQQLMDFFKDEGTCKAYYEKARWGEKVVCPRCGSEKVYRTNRGYKCANKICQKKFSVTVGTIFENSKIPLRTWFAAMFLISTSKKGVSSLQLATQLGITQKTAWFVLHRIREMLKDNDTSQLKNVVQADETFVGGKNKNRHADKKIQESQGRSTKDKTPIFGIYEMGGKVKVEVVPNTQAQTLRPIIEKFVKEGSIMVSDEWDSYNSIRDKYFHVVVNHKNGEYVRGAFHTNNIENFWSIFKRGYIGIYHYMSRQHLHRYATEFGYRYNTRKFDSVVRFEDALKKADTQRITYKELIGK